MLILLAPVGIVTIVFLDDLGRCFPVLSIPFAGLDAGRRTPAAPLLRGR